MGYVTSITRGLGSFAPPAVVGKTEDKAPFCTRVKKVIATVATVATVETSETDAGCIVLYCMYVCSLKSFILDLRDAETPE